MNLFLPPSALRGWFAEILSLEIATPMQPQPLYYPRTEDAAYQLRYSWTGWPCGKPFSTQPHQLIEETKPAWERDQLRLLEFRWTAEFVQLLFSATPDVSPEFVAARAKGRLDHALRNANIDSPFSRKVAVRTVGENTQRDVESYVDRQIDKEQFADSRFAHRMQQLTVINPQVDLSQPSETARGRYWYNLHLVLVVDRRVRIQDVKVLNDLREVFCKIAVKKGHTVSRLAVMQDHLHAALRARPFESPIDIAFAYQNNLALLTKQPEIWSKGFYVGTFGEYSMQAVRKRADH
jgi:REP element-mobilizing transposase RayT